MRLLGLDPGLQRTGWGVIRVDGSRLSHIANGTVATDAAQPIAARLLALVPRPLDLAPTPVGGCPGAVREPLLELRAPL